MSYHATTPRFPSPSMQGLILALRPSRYTVGQDDRPVGGDCIVDAQIFTIGRACTLGSSGQGALDPGRLPQGHHLRWVSRVRPPRNAIPATGYQGDLYQPVNRRRAAGHLNQLTQATASERFNSGLQGAVAGEEHHPPARQPAGPDRGDGCLGGLDAHPLLDGRRRRCGRNHL